MSDVRFEKVNTRVWDTVLKPNQFPELHDDEFKIERVINHRDLGIAFSGGGTRSASATLGQLRGLREIGLLDKVGYISAVSGGSWASTPFTFLPDAISDDTFLGPAVAPGDISADDLEYAPKGSLAHAISHTFLADDLFKSVTGGDETYARIIGRLFLKPFGLDDSGKFFTYDNKSLGAALKINNPNDQYFLTKDDFYMARKNRPFLIVSGTLLRKRNEPAQRKMQVEYTPIYTGIRQHFPKAGRFNGDIGGGYVESYAYDSKSPEQVDDNNYQVTLGSKRHRFSLADMVGSSGAAPEETVRKFGLTFLGFPEFRHFAAHPVDNIEEFFTREYPHGDGGHLENLGIMPLLARQVKKIIVFINTSTPFAMAVNGKGYEYTDDLAPLFGRSDNADNNENKVQLLVNQVFAKNKLDTLINGFANSFNNGNTLMHIDEYDVQENKHYGIRPYRAKICWICNSQVENWRNAITDLSIKNLIPSANHKVSGEFERFPHYRTFLENKGRIIDLSARQVNLLSHLSCWNIIEKQDALGKFVEQ